MKLKLKVCGMRDPQNIREVAALHPDFMGFIFYEKSKRFVGNNFSISSEFPNKIKRVGVFVNEKTEVILKLVEQHRLDFVQLHGGESVEKCESLKKNKVGVIKVFSIDKDFDFDEVNDFISCTDFFLFDTKSDGYGGSGLAFDWSMLNRYKANVPFFLSGGLSPENIAQALTLKTPNLFALDINSGVEISPGLKNIDKIKIINTILNSH
jgi:phosphoribosylanthranilate isomerase